MTQAQLIDLIEFSAFLDGQFLKPLLKIAYIISVVCQIGKRDQGQSTGYDDHVALLHHQGTACVVEEHRAYWHLTTVDDRAESVMAAVEYGHRRLSWIL